MENTQILIIGAGLTGLLIANRLQKKAIPFVVLEANDQIGGRIRTHHSMDAAPVEMGATWLGKKHTALNNLLKEFSIEISEQVLGDKAIYEPMSISPPQLVQLPPNNDPSFRIVGGTDTLIHKLADGIEQSSIKLSTIVNALEVEGNGVHVKGENFSIMTEQVISTLPPNLLVNSINFGSEVPSTLREIASSTHTWMGESIKVALTFKDPFWRAENLSGTIFSNVGPIPEMYDHSNFEDDRYALKGFLNGSYFSLNKSERLELVLKQLHKYFGDKINDYLSYEETVWRNEKYIYTDYNGHVLPHQNNGHIIYQQAFWDGKLIIAGSETAAEFPGYMEGAVRSANYVIDKMLLC